MSSSDESGSNGNSNGNGNGNESIKYKGVRRRKWGKWVTEIRVPGTQERLWLGSYSTPEGAAGAHDVAAYCLRGMSYLHKLNFPQQLPPTARPGLSPQAIQKATSDAGMAIDARFALMKQPNDDGSTNSYSCGSVSSSSSLQPMEYGYNHQHYHDQNMVLGEGEPLSISVDDYL